jgi:multidrug transporter EmrE-like cation transporter
MIACGVFLTAGDILMKIWVEGRQTRYYITGLILYIVGVNFLAFSYLYRNIAVATTLTNIFNILILTAVSWFWFKDKLTIQEMIGIAFAIVAIIILEWK